MEEDLSTLVLNYLGARTIETFHRPLTGYLGLAVIVPSIWPGSLIWDKFHRICRNGRV